MDFPPGYNTFSEQDSLLALHGMTSEQFIRLSCDSAWSLPARSWIWLKRLRDDISYPDKITQLQKVIPAQDINYYTSGQWGIHGYITKAADVILLKTMHDLYWGLRLDYPESPYTEHGQCYIIRFYTQYTEHITIPYFDIKGDSVITQWPAGGGGFTTSALGYGGFPEWYLDTTLTVNDSMSVLKVDNTEIIRIDKLQTIEWIAGNNPDCKPKNLNK